MSGETSRMQGLAAVVLAGGASRRMQRDKALLRLPDGRTALQAVLETARAVASPVLLAVDSPEHGARLLAALDGDAPALLLDAMPNAGPLAALAGALRAAAVPALLALAVDTPLVGPALLRALAEARAAAAAGGPAVAVAVVGGMAQPLPAVYGVDVARAAEALLASGRADLRALLDHSGVRVRHLNEAELRRADPSLRSFLSANTPAEWQALLAHVAE